MIKYPVVVAYVPVLHQGYLDFFRRNPGDIFLLEHANVPEVEYLSRDMRALPANLIKESLLAIFRVTQNSDRLVVVADGDSLSRLASAQGEVVLPDEDVSRAVVAKYFPNLRTSFDSVFLRWNWGNVEKGKSATPDRCVTEDTLIQEIMGEAFEIATRSPDWWRQVGAILVRDGVPLITGWNTHLPTVHSTYIFGDPRTPFAPGVRIDLSSAHHAEKQIITHAARLGISTDGADIVVTTFPCPGCAMDIVESGIRRVYYSEGYSLLHANEILRSRNVEIIKVSKPPQE